jgi:VWFA-related protein
MYWMESSLFRPYYCVGLPLVAYCLLIPIHAQNVAESTQSPETTIKTNAQAVVVDVVVTKGNGDAVSDLRQQDFQVVEDGKPQVIDLFEEHAAASAPSAPPAPLPPHIYTNLSASPQSDSVNVLLLDSLNTPQADQAYVHKQILDFLRNIPPGARIAIFTLNSKLRLLQGFTGDGSLLKAALNSKTAAPGTTPSSRTRDDDLRDKEELSIIQEMTYNNDGGNQEAFKSDARSLAQFSNDQGGRRASMTLVALQQLARALAAIPGRKNLIWFASSFPVSIFPNGPNRQTLASGKEISDSVRLTAGLLTQSQVALYPVSAQGVMLDHTMNADSSGQPAGDDFEKAPLQEAPANAANIAAMEQLATDTGGEAIYTTNNLNKAMAHAMQNGAHYYTLVYTPANKQLDGKFRHIDVKIAQGKYKLAYRRGYFADDLRAPQAQPVSDPLPPLLAHGLPAATQIVYELRVLPESAQPSPDSPRAGGNSNLPGPIVRYKADFVIPASAVDLEPQADGTHNGKIEIALIAYDPNGTALNWTGGAMNLSLNPASFAKIQKDGVPAHLEIDLPPVDAFLATGVYDWGLRRAGTLEIPIAKP